jgi:hypothetical protein
VCASPHAQTQFGKSIKSINKTHLKSKDIQTKKKTDKLRSKFNELLPSLAVGQQSMNQRGELCDLFGIFSL